MGNTTHTQIPRSCSVTVITCKITQSKCVNYSKLIQGAFMKHIVWSDWIIICAPRIHSELCEQRDKEDHRVGDRNSEHHQEDRGGRKHRQHPRQGVYFKGGKSTPETQGYRREQVV